MNDFDFFLGTWTVVNRRLLKPLTGSDEWDEFPATSTCHTVFDGAGNFDEISFPTKGFTGMTLRLFAPGTGQWSIYWANSRTGLLQPPVHGGFTDDVGLFYGDDEHDGRPVRVRYTWAKGESPRWDQAFSLDGQDWETNWIMEFSRATLG
ncbi:hypothetical protein AB5J62_28345 [Amycolatopsis sp. cg5]|uniref:hypothetical protein n=1 Tax=Amycolatopsis sp. cg5 TaxID=3238802 RepID=UPI0035259BF1